MNGHEPTDFGWLADAPLFIDAAQVEQLYDAAVRPVFADGPSDSSDSAAVGGLLQHVCGDRPDRRRVSRKALCDTPPRQLAQLLFAYAESAPDRLLRLSGSEAERLFDEKYTDERPRAIVVLDMPDKFLDSTPAVKLVPLGVETGDTPSRVVLLNALLDAQSRKQGSARRRPSVETNDYWYSYFEQYDPWEVVTVMTDGLGGGRPRWLDFRVPVRLKYGDPRNVHLHLVPAGKYDSGTFIYRMVLRGHQHGLRIVGTLHAGASLNVLAVYEK